MDTTFSNLLKTSRKNKNILIKDLANLMGIDASLISKFESGSRIPTKEQVHSLSNHLDIDLKLLMSNYISDQIIKEYGANDILKEAFIVAEQKIEYQKINNKSKNKYLNEIIDKIDKLKLILDQKRKNESFKVAEALELEYTYESNKIEGNTLTLQETNLVVNEGITINGKTMREHLEAINHKEAIEFIKSLLNKDAYITERIILQIHQLVLRGIEPRYAGVYRNIQVMISGSTHIPVSPYLVPKQMELLMEWYIKNQHILHPIELAAEMHERLVTIHPFIDGNGRTSRLIMNLILLKHGYVIANIKGSLINRQNYYKALEQVRTENNKSIFNEYIAGIELECMERYIKILS